MVRHVGEPVAFVVAENWFQAQDAADAIEINYEVLPATVDAWGAAEPSAPEADHHLMFDCGLGNEEQCKSGFRNAAHVIGMTIHNNRIVINPMETRNAVGSYDPLENRWTLITGTQGVHLVRNTIADSILGVDRSQLEVITPDVGGAFGTKIFVYPEQVLVLLAARRLGRTVKWIAQRSEGFLSDTQARAHLSRAELAVDGEGRFLALRVDTVADLGAYVSMYAPYVAAECGFPVICGAYTIPAVFVRVRGVLTNTVPVDAYRGAGRPEATYLLERLIDTAARKLGIDRADIRRRNMVEDRMSFRTATGVTLEKGNFVGNMQRALASTDYDGFEVRRRESLQQGRLRGFGFANYVEVNGGLGVARSLHPGGVPQEGIRIRIAVDGQVDLWVGTQSTGQRHHAVLAGLVAARFGLDAKRVRVHQGDSSALAFGGGTGGSRSLIAGLAAVDALSAELRSAAMARAAEYFKASEIGISEREGIFQLVGTNRVVGLVELLSHSKQPLELELTASYHSGTHANGCHACELEIDRDTGNVEILRYLAVDDFGRVLDRAAVFGQICGGIAQGIGQALYEQTVYEPGSGQLLSGSLMDYALPRADNLPAIAWLDNGCASENNSLGIKACGESGASGAPPAVMNALADALAGLVPSEDIQMPATPYAIYQWLHAGHGRTTADANRRAPLPAPWRRTRCLPPPLLTAR
jgi:aerobic carbon-monoxide dehydrogenase large subunit